MEVCVDTDGFGASWRVFGMFLVLENRIGSATIQTRGQSLPSSFKTEQRIKRVGGTSNTSRRAVKT
eukprot:6480101-Amphidinium_carterae.2